jgi:hypothetical protein
MTWASWCARKLRSRASRPVASCPPCPPPLTRMMLLRPQEPQGGDEIQIYAEMPHLVGKCVYFARGPTVDPKNGITAKSIENDISW